MRLLLALVAVTGALLNSSAGVAVVAAAGQASVIEPAYQLFQCDAATGDGVRIAVRDVVECIARSSPTNIVFVHPTVRLDCKCVRPACATPASVVGGPKADYECPAAKEILVKQQQEAQGCGECTQAARRGRTPTGGGISQGCRASRTPRSHQRLDGSGRKR